jgi:hypothetical protein
MLDSSALLRRSDRVSRDGMKAAIGTSEGLGVQMTYEEPLERRGYTGRGNRILED